MRVFNPREVPKERPASFDEKGKRVYLYPASVKGFFRRWRDLFYTFLLTIFLIVPWTKFAGEQTILLSLAERRFVFFGYTFWAHDTPLIFFVVALLAVGLTCVTVLWGRVWCGWACPQTVFIDHVFRRIETWVEGNHIQRMKRDRAPMNFEAFWKKSLKWILFFLVSAHISHSFVAYFVGADDLVWITLQSPAKHWGLFLTTHFLTAVILFDFGWFREQFCLIVCPYGRFQSVLLDKHSTAIMYDSQRGEPRGAKKSENNGDCVDCFRCVSVCPTGIDIREGLQMECIACTACIDACDEVMEKVKKPKGLIRYSSEAKMSGDPSRKLTPRAIVNLALFGVLLIGFILTLALRSPIEIKAIRAIGAPYTEQIIEGQKMVINHFRLHIKNQSQYLQDINLKPMDIDLVAPTLPVKLSPGENVWQHVFIKAPAANFYEGGRQPLTLEVEVKTDQGKRHYPVSLQLLGPES